mgnify:CR=1 FL=1
MPSWLCMRMSAGRLSDLCWSSTRATPPQTASSIDQSRFATPERTALVVRDARAEAIDLDFGNHVVALPVADCATTASAASAAYRQLQTGGYNPEAWRFHLLAYWRAVSPETTALGGLEMDRLLQRRAL